MKPTILLPLLALLGCTDPVLMVEDTEADGATETPTSVTAPKEDSPHSTMVLGCSAQQDRETRLRECLDGVQNPLLETVARPTDATDLLYYVNRWHSVDPCWPSAPDAGTLEVLRTDYVNAAGTEPEMLGVCGSYRSDLVGVPSSYTDGSAQQLRAVAWESQSPTRTHTVGFKALFDAAFSEGRYRCTITSGFRSAATQKGTFDHWTTVEGGDAAAASVYSAEPLHSEHQLGTTADVTCVPTDGSPAINPFFDPVGFYESPQGRWLRANVHRFGIVMTYMPDRVEIHQYKPEPWHLRFVGAEAADLLNRCDLSTEELLSHRYGVEGLPEFENMHRVEAAVRADGWTDQACFAPPETDLAPTGFCASHSMGAWCDGGDRVVCSADGRELERRACSEGCCTMPDGFPDVCVEDASEAQIQQTNDCTGPAEPTPPPPSKCPDGCDSCLGEVTAFCSGKGGWYCDGTELVTCEFSTGREVCRKRCDAGCQIAAEGEPDFCR